MAIEAMIKKKKKKKKKQKQKQKQKKTKHLSRKHREKVLRHWFSNLSKHHNHMEGLSKHRRMGPIPRASDSVDLGRA